MSFITIVFQYEIAYVLTPPHAPRAAFFVALAREVRKRQI